MPCVANLLGRCRDATHGVTKFIGWLPRRHAWRPYGVLHVRRDAMPGVRTVFCMFVETPRMASQNLLGGCRDATHGASTVVYFSVGIFNDISTGLETVLKYSLKLNTSKSLTPASGRRIISASVLDLEFVLSVIR